MWKSGANTAPTSHPSVGEVMVSSKMVARSGRSTVIGFDALRSIAISRLVEPMPQRGIASHAQHPLTPAAAAGVARDGSSTVIASSGRTTPPAMTTAITPALRIRLPCSSRSSTAAIRPRWMLSSCVQGLRRPVISTIASSPSRSRVPVGRSSSAMPRVVIFSPICPAATVKPAARNSSCSSAWIR